MLQHDRLRQAWLAWPAGRHGSFGTPSLSLSSRRKTVSMPTIKGGMEEKAQKQHDICMETAESLGPSLSLLWILVWAGMYYIILSLYLTKSIYSKRRRRRTLTAGWPHWWEKTYSQHGCWWCAIRQARGRGSPLKKASLSIHHKSSSWLCVGWLPWAACACLGSEAVQQNSISPNKWAQENKNKNKRQTLAETKGTACLAAYLAEPHKAGSSLSHLSLSLFSSTPKAQQQEEEERPPLSLPPSLCNHPSIEQVSAQGQDRQQCAILCLLYYLKRRRKEEGKQQPNPLISAEKKEGWKDSEEGRKENISLCL